MRITLSGYELADAINAYIELNFGKQVNVEVDDEQEVTAYVAFHSLTQEEEEPTDTGSKKRQRTRTTKKKEVFIAPVPEAKEEDEPVLTHYANLPQLTPEERKLYIQVLELLNNNPFNKNKEQIEHLVKTAPEDVRTVIQANEYYQAWTANCLNTEVKPSEEPSENSTLNESLDISENNSENIEQNTKTTNPLFVQETNVQKTGSLFPATSDVKKVF